MTLDDGLYSKIYGCLAGVAVGDALGFPMHDLPKEEILRRFQGTARTMVEPFEDDFIHIGFKSGQITDDTILTIQTALAIISCHGSLKSKDMVQWLASWAKSNEDIWKASEVFGPSTKKALQDFINLGEKWVPNNRRAPFDQGTSNGGVMRVAPAGLVFPGNLEGAVELAYQVTYPTHGTHVAISAAAAHAAGIAIALLGDSEISSIVDAAIEGAKLGEKIGRERARIVPAPQIEIRIEMAVNLANHSSDVFEAGEKIQNNIGTNLSAAEAYPAALGLFVAAKGDPETCILGAVNTGGDTDTIASITGAIAGAYKGIDYIPDLWLQTVEKVNRLQLDDIAKNLYQIASQH